MTLVRPSFEGFPFASDGEGSPIPTSGLAMWLDAARGVTLDGGTSRVTGWASRAGGASATQATTAAMPLLVAAALNGLPAVQFDGADDALAANAVAGGLSGDARAITVFAVEKADSVSGARCVLGMGLASNLSGPLLYALNNGNTKCLWRKNDAGTAVLANGPGGTATTLSTVGSYRYDGSTVACWKDGTLAAIASPSAGTLTLDRLAIGAAANLSAYFQGLLGELIVYGRALSDAERVRVESFLKGKWGIA